MYAIFYSFVLLLSLYQEYEPTAEIQFIEETVDTIGVVHVESGSEYVFFFDFVQQEWMEIDYRLRFGEMIPGKDGELFTLFWFDTNDYCWRLIKSKRWIETWTPDSPVIKNNNKPWFAQMCNVGLKKPPEKK